MADKVDVTIVAGPNVTVMVTVRIMVEEIPQPHRLAERGW